MIYELIDTGKAEKLFEGMEDSLIRSCLQGIMGKIYVTDLEAPCSAAAFLGANINYAGEPDRELVSFKPEGVIGMISPDGSWEKLIKEVWPDAEVEKRYAIKKDARFDREKLRAIMAALPEGYEIRRIDGDIFDACREIEDLDSCGAHFESKEDFLENGRGFAVLKDGKPVSAASSYSWFREGIEIQIDTVEDERGKGLASAVGAALILSCLDDGLYPCWDASGDVSKHLAQKLGYEVDHEYNCYWLDGIFDRVVKDPDKSGWSAFCGRYERQTEDRKVFEILMKDGALFVNFVNSEGKATEFKLYPVGDNVFGIAWSDDVITFTPGCMDISGQMCKKL